jgi:hypothetical protein
MRIRVKTAATVILYGVSLFALMTLFRQHLFAAEAQTGNAGISGNTTGTSNQKSTSSSQDYIDKVLATYKANSRDSSFITDPTQYQRYLAFAKAEHAALGAAEQQRLDKQTSSSSGSGNSTSSTSKASVPWLLGFAVEHGALTQSVDNNLITVRGNVANIFKTLDAKDYVDSYRRFQDNYALNLISRAAFSLSYASGTSQATTSQGTLAGYSVHVDLYNHRDPRDRRYIKQWASVVNRSLTTLATRVGETQDLITLKHGDDLRQWQNRANTAAQALKASSTDAEIRTTIHNIADDYVKTFGQYEDIRVTLQPIAAAAEEYSKEKGEVVQLIEKSPAISIEYTDTQQASTALPHSSSTTTTVTAPLPNLSNINLISEFPFIGRSQMTFNLGTTLFTSLPAGSTSGTIRDYRASAQTDIPLPELPQLGKATLSLSGMFLSLLEEPLGQQILVNGVAESRRGNIGLFQATLSVPIKGAGVKIPISITASNRTELIKESDVRGTIGITLDLDSLLAKP